MQDKMFILDNLETENFMDKVNCIFKKKVLIKAISKMEKEMEMVNKYGTMAVNTKVNLSMT